MAAEQDEEISTQARSVAAKKRYAKAVKVNTAKDDVLVAIAKLGGISRADAEASGINPAEFSRKGWTIKPVFTINGATLEGMAEKLAEYEYMPGIDADGGGENAMLDILDKALRGEAVLAPEGYEDEYGEFAWGMTELTSLAEQAMEIDEERTVDIMSQPEDVNDEQIVTQLLEVINNENESTKRETESAGVAEEKKKSKLTKIQEPALESYTQEDLDALQAEHDAREQVEKDAKDKSQADEDVDSFVLTGSDRQTDEGAAVGQVDIDELTASQKEFNKSLKEGGTRYEIREGEDGAEAIKTARRALGELDRAGDSAVSTFLHEPRGEDKGGRDQGRGVDGDIPAQFDLQRRGENKEKNTSGGINTLGIGITGSLIHDFMVTAKEHISSCNIIQ